MKHINHNYYILIYYFFRCRWFRAGVLPSPTSGATSPLPTSLLVSPTSRPTLAPPPPLCPASALRHQDQELVVHAGRHRARLSPGNFKRDFRPAIFLVSFSSKLIIGLRIFCFAGAPELLARKKKVFFLLRQGCGSEFWYSSFAVGSGFSWHLVRTDIYNRKRVFFHSKDFLDIQ